MAMSYRGPWQFCEWGHGWFNTAKGQGCEHIQSGVEQSVARQPHKLEAEGSSPSPATCPMRTAKGEDCFARVVDVFCMPHLRVIAKRDA